MVMVIRVTQVMKVVRMEIQTQMVKAVMGMVMEQEREMAKDQGPADREEMEPFYQEEKCYLLHLK